MKSEKKSVETPVETPEVSQSTSLAEGLILLRTAQHGSGMDYFVYRPAGAGGDAPLFVAIHHNSRDPEEQANVFRRACERYGVVLIAPHFTSDRFPDYQRLGRDRSARANGEPADVALNAIVEEVASLLGGEPRPVHLFGYAAGARFAMRYAMAHPDRVAGLVIASAGSYTLPDPDLNFPLGIGARSGGPDPRFDAEKLLRVPITVFEPRHGARSTGVRRSRRVGRSSQPGPERSGRSWYAAMKAAAERHGLASPVSYREVRGSAISFKRYAEREELADRVFEALFGPAPATARYLLLRADEPRAPGEQVDTSRAAPDSHWRELRRRVLTSVAITRRRVLTPVAITRRRVLISVAILGLIAVLAPVLVWVHYRFTHVISRDAVVRGPIADVGSRVDGVVQSVEVDTGERVVAGQIIARLHDRHFEAKVRHARSQLEKATRELEVERLAIANERLQLKSSLREESARSAAALAELAAAESLAAEAQRRMELQQLLASQGVMSQEKVRITEEEHRTARARQGAAAEERKAAAAAREVASAEFEGLAVREKRVSVLESEIAAYQAELAVAQANLEGAVIRAPDDGSVVRRIVEPGAAIVVGQPVLSLWLGGELWVEAWVDEDDLGGLGVGSEATVTFASHPDREFMGVVESVLASTDYELPETEVPQPRHERMRNTPVISVRVRLEETDAALFPGLSAVVGIREKQD